MTRSNILFFMATMMLSINVLGQQKFLLTDESDLSDIKKKYLSNGNKKLINKAKSAMFKGPFSVTFNKSKLAPTGDIHDYLSQAPYWWPDSARKNGEPYIRKDGRRNPEIYRLNDRKQLGDLTETVSDLAIGYYLSQDEKFAKRADEILNVFFINPDTRMNPNLRYAQYIPGVNDGRGIGIIETRGLIDIPEALTLLQESNSLYPQTVQGVKLWFAEYLKWLIDSNNGKSEKLEKNNHGTNYDLQVIDFALFLGDEALAKKTIHAVTVPRLEVQFDQKGSQPLENVRTNSWDYVNMNLDAWLKLARLAENVGVDLWHKKNSKGVGIQAAVEWLIPYANGSKKWPYQQLNAFGNNQADYIIKKAEKIYPSIKPR